MREQVIAFETLVSYMYFELVDIRIFSFYPRAAFTLLTACLPGFKVVKIGAFVMKRKTVRTIPGSSKACYRKKQCNNCEILFRKRGFSCSDGKKLFSL